jgi:hypothetical protein
MAAIPLAARFVHSAHRRHGRITPPAS